MSQTYEANYNGYQDWYADQNAKFESVYNNEELAEEHPMEYIGELLFVIMQTYNGYPAWTGEGIDHAANDTTAISNLEGLFSNPQSYSTDQAKDIINQYDEMYQQAYSVASPNSPSYDPSNPFFNVDQTIIDQSPSIFPSGWTFPTGSNLTDDDVTECQSYWGTQWEMAAGGNTSEITATDTAFSNELSAVDGVNSAMQSETKYFQSQSQEIQSLFQNTTKSVAGFHQTSVQNEIPS